MKKTKLIQLVSVFAILIIPSLFYVILTAGEHDIARLSFYGPEGIGESGIGEGANDSVRYELDPSIKFQTSTGDSSSFGDLRENILVIHFFCTDCSQESDRVITQIQELALKFEDKEDVRFLSITTDADKDNLEAVADLKKKFRELPSNRIFALLNEEQALDLASNHLLMNLYGEIQNPFYTNTVVVVDKEGRLRAFEDGVQYLNKGAIDDAIEALRFAYFRNEQMTKNGKQ